MNPRDVVARRLVAQARRFPDLDISPLETGDLDQRDAALARAIDHAVVSRWLTLQRVIESQLTRPWDQIESKMQAVLLVGAAQLLLFDRLPDHAVINEAVEWAKNNIRSKAGGMVNAILRKVASLRERKIEQVRPESFAPESFSRRELLLGDGRAWSLSADVFDQAPLRRLAQQTSHGEELINRWLAIHGPQATAKIALHDLVSPPIVINLAGKVLEDH